MLLPENIHLTIIDNGNGSNTFNVSLDGDTSDIEEVQLMFTPAGYALDTSYEQSVKFWYSVSNTLTAYTNTLSGGNTVRVRVKYISTSVYSDVYFTALKDGAVHQIPGTLKFYWDVHAGATAYMTEFKKTTSSTWIPVTYPDIAENGIISVTTYIAPSGSNYGVVIEQMAEANIDYNSLYDIRIKPIIHSGNTILYSGPWLYKEDINFMTYAVRPTINPSVAQQTFPFTASFTGEAGSTFHYTTNGVTPNTSDPSGTSVVINGPVELRVIAVVAGKYDSPYRGITYSEIPLTPDQIDLSTTGQTVNLVATGGYTSKVSLTWTITTGEAEATVYKILRDDIEIKAWTPISDWYDDITAVAGVNYTYKVIIGNNHATGTISDTDVGTKLFPLTSTPVIEPSSGEKSFPFTATFSCSDPNPTFYYTIDGTTVYQDDPQGSSVVITGPCTLKVKAISGNNRLSMQTYKTYTELVVETVPVPSGIVFGTITETSIYIDWNSTITSLSASCQYNLQYKKTSDSTWIDVHSILPGNNFTGLTHSTSYDFRIQAHRSTDTSIVSNWSSVYTDSTSETIIKPNVKVFIGDKIRIFGKGSNPNPGYDKVAFTIWGVSEDGSLFDLKNYITRANAYAYSSDGGNPFGSSVLELYDESLVEGNGEENKSIAGFRYSEFNNYPVWPTSKIKIQVKLTLNSGYNFIVGSGKVRVDSNGEYFWHNPYYETDNGALYSNTPLVNPTADIPENIDVSETGQTLLVTATEDIIGSTDISWTMSAGEAKATYYRILRDNVEIYTTSITMVDFTTPFTYSDTTGIYDKIYTYKVIVGNNGIGTIEKTDLGNSTLALTSKSLIANSIIVNIGYSNVTWNNVKLNWNYTGSGAEPTKYTLERNGTVIVSKAAYTGVFTDSSPVYNSNNEYKVTLHNDHLDTIYDSVVVSVPEMSPEYKKFSDYGQTAILEVYENKYNSIKLSAVLTPGEASGTTYTITKNGAVWRSGAWDIDTLFPVDIDVSPETTYTYVLSISNNAETITDSVQVLTPPDLQGRSLIVDGATVALSTNDVRWNNVSLTWVFSNNEALPTKYSLDRNGVTIVSLANYATSYIDSSPVYNSDNTYKITLHNNHSDVIYNQITETIPDMPPEYKKFSDYNQNLIFNLASKTINTVTLSLDIEDGEAAPTHYSVKRNGIYITTLEVWNENITILDTGLTPGSTNTYVAEVRNLSETISANTSIILQTEFEVRFDDPVEGTVFSIAATNAFTDRIEFAITKVGASCATHNKIERDGVLINDWMPYSDSYINYLEEKSENTSYNYSFSFKNDVDEITVSDVIGATKGLFNCPISSEYKANFNFEITVDEDLRKVFLDYTPGDLYIKQISVYKDGILISENSLEGRFIDTDYQLGVHEYKLVISNNNDIFEKTITIDIPYPILDLSINVSNLEICFNSNLPLYQIKKDILITVGDSQFKAPILSETSNDYVIYVHELLNNTDIKVYIDYPKMRYTVFGAGRYEEIVEDGKNCLYIQTKPDDFLYSLKINETFLTNKDRFTIEINKSFGGLFQKVEFWIEDERYDTEKIIIPYDKDIVFNKDSKKFECFEWRHRYYFETVDDFQENNINIEVLLMIQLKYIQKIVKR